MSNEKLSNEKKSKALNKHSVMQGWRSDIHYKQLRSLILKMQSDMRAARYEMVDRSFGPLLQVLENVDRELTSQPTVGQRSVGQNVSDGDKNMCICRDGNYRCSMDANCTFY